MLNYLAILLSYLTQDILLNPEVQRKLFSARYCKSLVFNLIDEEDMVNVVKHFFTKTFTGTDSESPIYIIEIQELIKFELNIHYRFHKVSLTQIRHDSCINPDLAHSYGHSTFAFPNQSQLEASYIEPKNTEQLNNHDVVLAFISLRKPLRVGAMLLPIALKLYDMFHVDLNYVLLKDMAKSKTITDFVNEVSSRQQSLNELKDLVKDFKNYLPECIALRRPNLEIDELPSNYPPHVPRVECGGEVS